MIVLLKPLTVGSPPRMRGKQGEGRYQPSLTRITPADAGKTASTECPGLPDRYAPGGKF